jgi:LuxR family maltose regulon positive regulatory protein
VTFEQTTAGALARPLVATKLFVPIQRRSLVERPRLRERLRRGAEATLTLVSAPAGFGKTTLLAEWLTTSADDRTVAWLSLDSTDNDPATFWPYVVTALQNAAPGVGTDALELLTSAASVPIDSVLTTLLNDLAARPGEVWLVLDDYHQIQHQEIARGMTFFLEHLPHQIHLVLSTRADPDLPLARWRAHGELVEIRAVDLRFTADETTAYLTGSTARQLPAEDVAILQKRTEGWIAALQLAALSIRDREDASNFIAQFAGDARYVVDYLVEEVLAHQPEPVRTFLMHSAILDGLSAPLCDVVTNRDDSAQMLAALERDNLFLVALDERREWYRYHQLFAEVLRSRLLALQPGVVSILHQRASLWYEQHDLTAEAVAHALAAGDFERAARLAELAVPAIRQHRREAMMYAWLEALPEETIRHSPVLSVFYGSMLLAGGELDAVETRLDDAERELAAVPPGVPAPWTETDELRTLPATIAIYRASLAQARGDPEGTAEHARRALALAGPDDHLARGGAAGFLGLAAWAAGDVSTALETFGQATASLHAAGNLVDELGGTVVLADLWLASGRPGTARRLLERGLQRARTYGEAVGRATAELHVGLSEIELETGDLERARRHLEAARLLGDRVGAAESRFRWFIAMARAAQLAGDPQASLDHLDRAEQLYRPGFFPDVRPIAAVRARLLLAQGDLEAAADWARNRNVSATDEAHYLHEFDHLTLVRLLLAQHRTHPDSAAIEQAQGLLARLLEAAETAERAGSLLEIRLLDALTYEAQGRLPEAVGCLTRALRLAPEPSGYVRLFLDEGEPMSNLLRRLPPDVRAGDSLTNDHVRRLLSVTGEVETATSTDPRTPRSLPNPLSDRELQVLRLLDSEQSGPEIAQQLFVSHNTLRTHTKHIFTKLDVSSRRAAVRRAREWGLL